MIRKIIVRGIIACVALVVLGASALAVAAVMALQPPGFYSELRSVTYTPAEQAQANAELTALAETLDHWAHLSLARQRTQQRMGSDPFAKVALLALANGGVPADDVHEFTITEQQLNAYLSSKPDCISRQIHAPRVRFLDHAIQFGFELPASRISTSLGAKLHLTSSGDGAIQLDLLGGQIGRLPIPLATLLRLLPPEATQGDEKVQLDFAADPPNITLQLDATKSRRVTIQSIDCREGQLTLVLQAPGVEPNLD